MLDANGHTVGSEIRDLQRDHLADPQTGGVGRREQEAVPGVRAGIEQAPDFLAAEDLRQLLRLLGGGDVEVDLRVAERHMVEEPEGVRRLAARAPGQLALLDQVSEVDLHLVVGELIRRPLVVLRQLHHLADVGLVGAARETAQRHVADHAGTKLAHGNTSSEGNGMELEGVCARRERVVFSGESAENRGVGESRERSWPDRCPTYRASGLVQLQFGPEIGRPA